MHRLYRCSEVLETCLLFVFRALLQRAAELCLGCVLIGLLLLHIANHESANTPQLMDPDK